MKNKPIAIDLFCGLGGWAEGFLSEGYQVFGFDIERHDWSAFQDTSGLKQGGDWFGKAEAWSMCRRFSSKSNSRKAASAMIAKIPFPLAQHIARVFKPHEGAGNEK